MSIVIHAAAFPPAASRCVLIAALALVLLGCRTAPKNPFAERAKAEQAGGELAVAQPLATAPGPTSMPVANRVKSLQAESTELAGLGAGAAMATVALGNEAALAAKDAAARVELAAKNAVARQSAEAQDFATRATATAEQSAESVRQVAYQTASNARQAANQLTSDVQRSAGNARQAAIEAERAAVDRAYAELENASADVRREACEYLAAHADPRHTQALLRTLADPQTSVKVAAIRALGAAEKLADPRPLIELLDARDTVVRVEAATALARLHVEQGTATLERMALDTDAEVRLRAALAMGEIANPAFLPALVAMLGDAAEVRQAAMASLARIAGNDVGSAPASDKQDGAVPTDEQRAQRWRLWYAQHSDPANVRR